MLVEYKGEKKTLAEWARCLGMEYKTLQCRLKSGWSVDRAMTTPVMKNHGGKGTKEYNAWNGLKGRCLNPNNKQYSRYGGRGIKVCDRWINSFQTFLDDMGKAPSKKHSVERLDVNGDYSPENCCWATAKEQANNRRNNRVVKCDGRKQTLQQWADEKNLCPTTLRDRLDAGWSIEKALNTPAEQYCVLTCGNRTQTLGEWADEIGLKPNTIVMRLRRGWSIEKALSTPLVSA